MKQINCPHCDQGLQAYQHNDIDIEYCPSCKGVVLDEGELDPVAIETAGSIEYSTFASPTIVTENKQTISCPKCPTLTPMQKVGFLGDQTIVLDHCDACGVIWLDYQELEQINTKMTQLNQSSTTSPLSVRILNAMVYFGLYSV